ncbi:rhamnulokinase family protein [uncultured Cohaesibacter sp.]|uniref:rhamnulokinase n=1 Tax=uncultured Cohaesibacter sp. TaxID=1002546 RepID=UPI00292E061D|nr:rhamnulokinase family protein [uncultured Cohaesibacter sp.]
MAGRSVLAVDLGASSGRVVKVSLGDDQLTLEEINRFPHGPQRVDGNLCWDLDYLWSGICEGLGLAFEADPTIASIGADSWAVDFVPVDVKGNALLPFVSYRDERTSGIVERFLSDCGLTDRELFQKTGIQSLEFNTLYQLFALKDHPLESYQALDRFMLLPDWIHFELTGLWSSEYTNASASQMLSVHDRDWDPDLLQQVGMPLRAMPKIRQAGEILGPIKPEFCKAWNLPVAADAAPQVVLGGTHDTASAVAALPSLAERPYFISLGTWALVGCEAPVPDLSDYAHEHGLSNEGGVFDSYRQLRNVSGLWFIQNVREELAPESDFADWVKAAEGAEPGRSLIRPMDERYFRTESMVSEIQAACRETGQPVPESHGELARCIFESLALQFTHVLHDFAKGETIPELHIVGGGGRNALLCQMTADFLGRPVVAGPFEASALGNAVVQMIGLGWISDIAEARRIIRQSQELLHFEPQTGPQHKEIAERYNALLARTKQEDITS